MLTTYVIALLLGGVLVGVSVFLGGDADVEAEAELEAEGDADAAAAHGLSAWLPFSSLRFWTFFLAFGGLTGTLLTVFDLLGPIATALASVGLGYVTGAGIAFAVRRLRAEDVSSGVSRDDFVGATAEVLLPVSRTGLGQVRVQLKGRDVDLVAVTDDADALAAHAEVLVYDVRDDGVVLVTANSNANERRAS